MNVHKKLKSWTQMVVYLAMTLAFISFIEPVFAGHIYDGNQVHNNNQRRLVRVVFGSSAHLPDSPLHHPDNNRTYTQFNNEDMNIGYHMRDNLPAINNTTHIEFWINPTVANHHTDAFLAELGSQANAYINGAPVNALTFETIRKP